MEQELEEHVTVEPEGTTRNIKKKPFLRKGTGLKRFYKDLDLENNTQLQTFGNPNNYPTRPHPLSYEPISYPHPSSVLKSADSPKRNLNVRFFQPSALNHQYQYQRGTDPKNAKSFDDKENWNPSSQLKRSSTQDDDDDDEDQDSSENSVDEEDWETETEDDEDDEAESVVELNESIVEEVFNSILKSKAQRELFPTNNHPNQPDFERQGIKAQEPHGHRIETKTNARDVTRL